LGKNAVTWFFSGSKKLAAPLAPVSREQERLPGSMKVLGFNLRGGRRTSCSVLVE